jgi:hypothetical protein
MQRHFRKANSRHAEGGGGGEEEEEEEERKKVGTGDRQRWGENAAMALTSRVLSLFGSIQQSLQRNQTRGRGRAEDAEKGAWIWRSFEKKKKEEEEEEES